MSSDNSNWPVIASAVLGLTVFALGGSRLFLEKPLRSQITNTEAIAVSGCFPPIEVPAAKPVTVLPILPVPLPGEKDSITTLDEKEYVVARTLDLLTTEATRVRLHFKLTPDDLKAGKVKLNDQTISVDHNAGAFELQLNQGVAALQNGDTRLLLTSKARFSAVTDTSYKIKVPANETNDSKRDVWAVLKDGGKDGKENIQAFIPAVTRLPVNMEGGLAVQPLQPLSTRIWMLGHPPALNPVRVTGQSGMADLAVDINKVGLRTGNGNTSLMACAFRGYEGTDPRKWHRVGTSSIGNSSSSSNEMTLSLPSNVLPDATEFSTPLRIAIVSSDGRNASMGGGTMIGRAYAAAAALVLTGGLFLLLSFRRGYRLQKKTRDGNLRWFSSMFIGGDGDPSLSLLQIFIWTTITVWGFLYVFLVVGNLLSMTSEMMQLLGIAGVGSVAARWIAASSGHSTSASPTATSETQPAPSQDVNSKASVKHDFWKLLSTNGNFDLLKLQLFVFTIVIAMYVVWRILDAAAFPVLDANTLMLLGVSQGVYVASKFASTNALTKAQTLRVDFETVSQAISNLQKQRQQAADAGDAGKVAEIEKKIADLEGRKAILATEYERSLDALKLAKT